MLVRLRNQICPPAFRGPLLVDELGVPRHWSLVYAEFLPGGMADETLASRLRPVDSFYRFADELLGPGRLDAAITAFDLDQLGMVLEGYFMSIKNRRRRKSPDSRWKAALDFVRDILSRITKGVASETRYRELSNKLARYEMLYSNLRTDRRRRAEPIRSLPLSVRGPVRAMLTPGSPNNPFRRDAQWRVFVIFEVLFSLGLRRAELLMLATDAVQHGSGNLQTFWLDIKVNRYQVDPRYSKPSVKTHHSIRPVAVSQRLANLIQKYAANYRGRPNHSFLINSRINTPLSTEGVTKIFREISRALPTAVKQDLEACTGKTSITPHDLRHTCVIMRLNQLQRRGKSIEGALQILRPFFGWSPSSSMPSRYARAFFEDAAMRECDDDFDDPEATVHTTKRSL